MIDFQAVGAAIVCAAMFTGALVCFLQASRGNKW